MCSTTEPRRATVSCKHLFSSTNNDRSIPTSSSRRHVYYNSNIKRYNNNNNNNNNNNTVTRTSNHSTKQPQRLNDVTNENSSHSNVFHIPFCFEQKNDNGKKLLTNNNKLLRTSLNPLSPIFYSTRHISLLSEEKQSIISR